MQYYLYETYAPSGTNPPHSVTAVTAKVREICDQSMSRMKVLRLLIASVLP